MQALISVLSISPRPTARTWSSAWRRRSLPCGDDGGGELAPLPQRRRAGIGGDALQAHVVGAGGVVVVDAAGDVLGAAPGHDGVDEAITAAVADVGLREPQT